MHAEVMMHAERPRIRSDAAPPRAKHTGELHRLVTSMARGEWVHVTHSRARSLQKVARELGGTAMRYRTSELFSVFKVLEAPWLEGVGAAASPSEEVA